MRTIFEKSSYEVGRYCVEAGKYGRGDISWDAVGWFSKKSSAITEAERLLAKGKCDRVRVIDTE